MAQRYSLEPFSKFISESFKGKLAHYKNALQSSAGLADTKVQRIASRLIQSKQFTVPSLAELSPSEWSKFGGSKLLREQAKSVNLLGSILPYETEGQAELLVDFGSNNISRRGNLILPEQTISPPVIKSNLDLQNGTTLLFDCDYPNDEGSLLLLWAKNGENELMTYAPPIPERGSGIHRIVCVQLEGADLPPLDKRFISSSLFNDATKIKSYNFFTTTWTRNVSEHIFPDFHPAIKERVFGEYMPGPGSN